MKKWFGKEVKIALSVLASILILYVGINYLKGINVMKPSNYYYVQFPNVAGLAQSAPVFIDGYKVGLVQEIVYDYDANGAALAVIMAGGSSSCSLPFSAAGAATETDSATTAGIPAAL